MEHIKNFKELVAESIKNCDYNIDTSRETIANTNLHLYADTLTIISRSTFIMLAYEQAKIRLKEQDAFLDRVLNDVEDFGKEFGNKAEDAINRHVHRLTYAEIKRLEGNVLSGAKNLSYEADQTPNAKIRGQAIASTMLATMLNKIYPEPPE